MTSLRREAEAFLNKMCGDPSYWHQDDLNDLEALLKAERREVWEEAAKILDKHCHAYREQGVQLVHPTDILKRYADELRQRKKELE